MGQFRAFQCVPLSSSTPFPAKLSSPVQSSSRQHQRQSSNSDPIRPVSHFFFAHYFMPSYSSFHRFYLSMSILSQPIQHVHQSTLPPLLQVPIILTLHLPARWSTTITTLLAVPPILRALFPNLATNAETAPPKIVQCPCLQP